jgi:hypothetical protein
MCACIVFLTIWLTIWLALAAYLLLRCGKLCNLPSGITYGAAIEKLHSETERTGELVRAYAEAWQQRLVRIESDGRPSPGT